MTTLAYGYRGGENGDVRFATHWWGILGLIGWAYLAGALITLFSKNNFYTLLSVWLFLCSALTLLAFTLICWISHVWKRISALILLIQQILIPCYVT